MTTISFGPLKTLAWGALLVGALSSNIHAASQTRQLPRELDFAYYSLQDGFASTLSLVNNSPTALSFAVTIFGRSGQSVVGPTTDLSPQANTSVDLSSILQAASIDATGDFSEGSVAVHYRGNGFNPLVGQLVISKAATGAAYTSEMVQNRGGSANGPAALNFMWWKLDRGETARIAVTNISGSAVVADVVLEFNGRHRPGSVLYFSAHQTMVLSMSDILDSLGETPGSAPQGGITIVPRGPGSPLIATGLLSNPTTGSATPLPVAHPDRQFVGAQHAIGMPVGVPSPDSPYVGLGTFEPHVVLRNLAAAPQTVTLTIEYPGNAGVQQLVLPAFPIEANTTQDVSLASALPQLPASLAFASIRIQYDGAADSLMGQVESREQRGRLVVSSSLVNEGDGQAGAGAHPWQVDHGTNSYLFLTDMGDKPARIGFQVQAKGVSYYLTNLTLQPHETRAMGMRELRDQQQADFRKNKIPVDATEGSVRWVRLDNVPVMGRLVMLKGQEHEIVSVGKGAGGTANGGGQAPPGSVNFICQDCFCPCPAGLQSLGYEAGCDVLNVISGQICGISFLGNYTDCNGNSSFFDDTLSSSVSSSDTSVATIANSTAPASLTGIGPGSADITASFADNTYPFAPNSCSPQLSTVSTIIPVRVITINITDADIENNDVNVTLSGPSGASGTLVVTANGATHTVSVAANGGSAVGPGQYTVSFNRPTMPVDTYTSVTAQWNVGGSGPSKVFALSRTWLVLGTIRHSQYNTPYESACLGGTQTAYVYDSSCTFTTVTLNSNFVSQTETNGTGVRLNNDILKFDDGSCSSKYPAGANSSNSLRKVSSITGQCGTTLVGGDSVATNPGPNNIGSKFNCGDNMLLVNASNVNAYLKHVADRCANTQDGCADGHVDNYSSTQACSARAVGDLPGSPYWTVDSH